MLKEIYAPLGLVIALLFSSLAIATVVQFQTVLGTFEVNLYDQDTPSTVENFLDYVNARAYDNVVIHRSVSNFVVQGGGFTVFGEVTGMGMTVIDAIAALPVFDLGGAFDSIALRNYSDQNFADDVPVTDQHLVLITAIVVLDGAADTAAGLSPVPNTLINAPPPPTPQPSSGGGGGGGSMSWAMLMLLGSLSLFRRRQQLIALVIDRRQRHRLADRVAASGDR